MLESVQKFALRVCSKQWNTDYDTLLAKFNLPSLEKRRLYLRLTYAFNLLKGNYLMPSPSLIELKYFKHNSRSHNSMLKIPFAKSSSYFHSFFCDALRLWNNLPTDIVSATDTDKFKELLLQYLYSHN